MHLLLLHGKECHFHFKCKSILSYCLIKFNILLNHNSDICICAIISCMHFSSTLNFVRRHDSFEFSFLCNIEESEIDS